MTIRNNGHYEQVVNFRDRDSSFIRRIRLREWSDGLELSVDVMGASRSLPDTLVVPRSPSPAIPDLNRNQRNESHNYSPSVASCYTSHDNALTLTDPTADGLTADVLVPKTVAPVLVT